MTARDRVQGSSHVRQENCKTGRRRWCAKRQTEGSDSSETQDAAELEDITSEHAQMTPAFRNRNERALGSSQPSKIATEERLDKGQR
jgi:hypothetical protein